MCGAEAEGMGRAIWQALHVVVGYALTFEHTSSGVLFTLAEATRPADAGEYELEESTQCVGGATIPVNWCRPSLEPTTFCMASRCRFYPAYGWVPLLTLHCLYR